MKCTELKQTIPMMESADYKERFKAEYYQLTIRLEKLKALVNEWGESIPNGPRTIYEFQIDAMEQYQGLLEFRAEMENIKLD